MVLGKRRLLLLRSLTLFLLFVFAWTGHAEASIGGQWQSTILLQPRQSEPISVQHLLDLRWFLRTPSYRWDVQGTMGLRSNQHPLLESEWTRLSYRRYFSWGDIAIGKQPIGGGVGQSWPGRKSPLNTYPDTVWAVTGRWNTGLFDFWSGALVWQEDGMEASVRRQGLVEGVRWSGLLRGSEDFVQVGFDAKLDWGIEWYGDFLVQVYPERQWQWLAGADYSWAGFFGVSELRYDNGTWWWFQSVSRHIDEFTNVAIALDFHPADRSRMWNAALDMQLTGFTKLQAFVSMPQGTTGSHYGSLAEQIGPVCGLTLTHSF